MVTNSSNKYINHLYIRKNVVIIKKIIIYLLIEENYEIVIYV